jgi:hypothetical protein
MSRIVIIQVLKDGKVMAEAAVGESLLKSGQPIRLYVAGEQTDDGPATTPWEILPGEELTMSYRGS